MKNFICIILIFRKLGGRLTLYTNTRKKTRYDGSFMLNNDYYNIVIGKQINLKFMVISIKFSAAFRFFFFVSIKSRENTSRRV